jgi:hypothetical protein
MKREFNRKHCMGFAIVSVIGAWVGLAGLLILLLEHGMLK